MWIALQAATGNRGLKRNFLHFRKLTISLERNILSHLRCKTLSFSPWKSLHLPKHTTPRMYPWFLIFLKTLWNLLTSRFPQTLNLKTKEVMICFLSFNPLKPRDRNITRCNNSGNCNFPISTFHNLYNSSLLKEVKLNYIFPNLKMRLKK